MMNRCWWVVAAVGVAAGTSGAWAQSLFMRNDPVRLDENGRPDPLATLRATSMMCIEAPRPKVFAIHDKVTIIIDETSKQSSKQTLDSKKNYDLTNTLAQFPGLAAFLDQELRNGILDPIKVDLHSKNAFKGEGTYDRSDRFTAKITATVIDVRPNGSLVLEARKTKVTDEESQTIVLSGECRQEDVTTSNTVLSSQIADLTLVTKNEGQVKDSSTKGFIPRVLEAIFNF